MVELTAPFPELKADIIRSSSARRSFCLLLFYWDERRTQFVYCIFALNCRQTEDRRISFTSDTLFDFKRIVKGDRYHSRRVTFLGSSSKQPSTSSKLGVDNAFIQLTPTRRTNHRELSIMTTTNESRDSWNPASTVAVPALKVILRSTSREEFARISTIPNT